MIQKTPLEPWIEHKIGSQSISRAELEAYQLLKLRQTLQLVRQKSQFYRAHLANSPADINNLAGLRSFPFTTADDIRSQPLKFLCVSQDEIQRVVTLQTSGTTGNPKRIYFTRDDQELTIDFFQHGMATFTRPGDRVLICLPGETLGSVGDLLATGLGRLGVHPIRYGLILDASACVSRIKEMAIEIQGKQRTAGRSVQSVEPLRPVDCIVGVPTQILALAHAWQHSVNEEIEGPSAILLSTDYVPEAIKNTLECVWGCTVFGHYGMTEMGLGGGVECLDRRGYHMREADLYFEIIDPETGQFVPDGEQGEVVFTTLTRLGMPLIRYRTGDVSRFLPGQCACGTLLKTLEKVRCRVKGKVTLQGGFLDMPELDEALFSLPGVLDFSAQLISQGLKDVLDIVLTIDRQAGDKMLLGVENQLARIASLAQSRQANMLEVRVSTRSQDAIDKTGAAKRRIVDRRN